VEDRQIFGVGPTNGVDRTEFTNPVGGADGPHAAKARVAIGRVAGIQFVATADPFDAGVVDDGILNRESEIPWDAKDVLDSDIAQAPQDVVNHSFRH
jgi:hypothetical protein